MLLVQRLIADRTQVVRHVLWHVLRNALRCVLHVPVPHVPVLNVSPKGKRGVGSELAGDDGKDKHLPARPPPSTRVLGVSPMGSAGAACVCWACLKIGRNCVFEMTNCHFSGPTATLTRTMVYTARCLQVTPRHSLPPSHTATTPFLRLLMICREITSRGHVLVSINFMSWYNGIVSSNSS